MLSNYHPLSKQTYIHLLQQDVPVWERFLSSDKNIYFKFEYDYRVGDGLDPGPEYDHNIRQMSINLSQKRIDAVGFASDHLALIEITRQAGMTALGQILVYYNLFCIQQPTHPPLKKILVCESLDSNCADSYNSAGIIIYLFPAP